MERAIERASSAVVGCVVADSGSGVGAGGVGAGTGGCAGAKVTEVSSMVDAAGCCGAVLGCDGGAAAWG